MRKNIIYIVVAVLLGLLVGYFIFNTPRDTVATATEHNHEAGETQLWTCSMHPQIMQPEPGDCPICGMDLIPAENTGNGLAPDQIKMTRNAMALANIQTTKVGTTEASEENTLTLSGKIQVNQEANAIQSSYFEGRLEKLYINYEGEKINKGALLATIYAPKLVAAQQELLTAASLKQSQPALYNAVRNKLKLWKLSEAQINNIETSGKVRENFPIYATVSGTVAEVMSAEGDYVNQGQPLLKISNLNSVWAVLEAYENQIGQLKEGQQVTLTTNAYPNREFYATISFIDPVLNTGTRTVMVRATLPNKEGLFKPGMFITGKIENTSTASETSQLTIPASALLWTGERSLVYVKVNKDEPVFEMREVTIGNRQGDRYTIVSGLNTGEEIVTNGTFTVDAAAQLQGKRSMMNQEKNASATNMDTSMNMKFTAAFQKEFLKMLPLYFQLKDNFVASNPQQISASATSTLEAFKKLDVKELGTMEKFHIQKSIGMLEAIVANKTLENQRDHFVVLNENLVVVAQSMEDISETIYIKKCPMANNNKGAVWLSKEKPIKNPYYGEAMLSCGSIIDTLQ